MSLNLTTWAWSVRGISYQAKFALLALADCCHSDREIHTCWPSIPWLCERTAMPKRTLIRALDELETARLISRSNGRGRYTTRYRLAGAEALATDPCGASQAPQDPVVVPTRHLSSASQAPQDPVVVPTRHLSSAWEAPGT